MPQLYGHPNVVGYERRKQSFVDVDDVVAKFGVPPESIPDYLALVGDTSDGYPGLPGWGAKSSATLLARYGHLEAIPLEVEQWDVTVRGAAKLCATFREHVGDALLYRYLAQLRPDVPLQESVDDLEWHGVPHEHYHAFCDDLGFTNLKDRPHRWTAVPEW